MQHLPPRRIAAIHDLSCVGRCALTVIIPTLSVMGYQTVPVPTALLSSHTGGFTNLHFRDLTDDMDRIGEHFERLDVRFGAIYTGFLGSDAQICSVTKLIEHFGMRPDETGEKPLILVDPVMGDDGALYSTYTEELVEGIRHLSTYAEVLTPNLTEACFLTHTPYADTAALSIDEASAFAHELLNRLTEVAPRARIVITGVHLSGGEVANFGMDADGTRFCVKRPHRGHAYPGTGDIFASVLLGALLDKESFESACARAADFTGMLIEESSKIATPARMGVALESYLHLLVRKE
ncbi:MAG: pyridoxamine kinase [Clostridia bacterium]|nr:pyridoxamine kinase [Clostridia bacterium]